MEVRTNIERKTNDVLNRIRYGNIAILFEVIKEYASNFLYTVIAEFDKISILLMIVVPFVLQSAIKSRIVSAVLWAVIMLVLSIIRETFYRVRSVNNEHIPVYSRRFTYKDRDGFVNINEKDQEEALLYLSEVEDYLQKKGRLKF